MAYSIGIKKKPSRAAPINTVDFRLITLSEKTESEMSAYRLFLSSKVNNMLLMVMFCAWTCVIHKTLFFPINTGSYAFKNPPPYVILHPSWPLGRQKWTRQFVGVRYSARQRSLEGPTLSCSSVPLPVHLSDEWPYLGGRLRRITEGLAVVSQRQLLPLKGNSFARDVGFHRTLH